jgi:hypothetical protein
VILRELGDRRDIRERAKFGIVDEGAEEICTWIIQWLSRFLGSDHLAWSWLKPAIIRHKAFSALKMKHTCCQLAEETTCLHMQHYLGCLDIHPKESLDALERIISTLDHESVQVGIPFTKYFDRIFHFRLKVIVESQFPKGALPVYENC